jgi:succinate dehydrogenase / fumarate reductase iron-sulfur subunit
VTVEPMKTFPADSRSGDGRVLEFRGQEEDQEVQAAQAGRAGRNLAMQQADVDRVQEFRKCIECFLCQDVCHVLRDHHMHASSSGRVFGLYGALEMNPLDTDDRLGI